MDSYDVTLIVTILIMIMGSAYFSATETAFTCVNKITLKGKASKGNKKAARVLALADNYDKLLTTILVGNNIVNIVSSSLATILFVKLSSEYGVVISTVVMTVLVLIFGEITPKSLAKENAESFAMFSAPILKFFTFILKPLVFIFGLWTKFVNKIFVKGDKTGYSEEELKTIVTEAQTGGGIDEHESKLITAAIEFNDVEVSDILTPRVNLCALNEEDSPKEILETFFSEGFSRLPVYKNTIDNIIGVLHQKNFYTWYHNGQKTGEFAPLETIISPVKYISESTQISGLLRQLQKDRTHMAVVVDEFGGTVGIVTLEDIIEELIGDIYDEHDKDEQPEMVPCAVENTYIIDGSMNIYNMLEELDLKTDEEFDSSTVGGWVSEQLGHIGLQNETFNYYNLTITIKNADKRRVQCIEVVVAPKLEENND